MTPIRRILVPVDFSAPSDNATEYALWLAKELGAELELMHSYSLPVYALPDGGVMVGPEYAARVSSAAQDSLDASVARYSGQGVTVRAHLTEGIPHEEVARLVEELDAQMVVMGTHGRAGMRHLLLGSVAERVVRTSKVPVLTVRFDKDD